MRKIVNHLSGQRETSPSCEGSYQGYVSDNKSCLHYQGQPENITTHRSRSPSCYNNWDKIQFRAIPVLEKSWLYLLV